MKSKLMSVLRDLFNNLTQVLIVNERIRKKLVVLYYNLKAFRYKKVWYASEEENVFDYQKVVSDKRQICREEYRGNAFYGIADALKSYSGFTGKIFACIEHGVYFGDYVNEKECVISGFPAILTFGEKRIEHLRNRSSKMLFAIGPYIYYAKDILDQEKIRQIKTRLGKTLLVFPTHSVDRVTVDMNSSSLIKRIKQFKEEHGFDTVLVCLYYRDVELGRAIEYEHAGFLVVSAGRREDRAFLNRLHTFFSISDYTLSNNVGTHIGYSVILGKPHTILEEAVEYNTASKAEVRHVTTLYNSAAVAEKKIVSEAFSKFEENITDRQKQVCNLFWGNDKVLSPSDLHFVLSMCQLVFKEAEKKEKNFSKAIEKCRNELKSEHHQLLFDNAING